MRSIVHEASSVVKAIEQGWIKAGKPRDFTVRIYEEPKKWFLWFTSTPAKIGIIIPDRSQGRGRRSRRNNSFQRRRPHYRRTDQGQQDTRRRDTYKQQDIFSKGSQEGRSSGSSDSRQRRPRRWHKPSTKK